MITGNKTAPTYIIGEAGVTISGATPTSCGYQDGLVCANANFLNLSNMTIDAGSTHGQSSGSEINGTNVTFDHVNLHGSFVSLYPRGQNFTWNVAASARTASTAANAAVTRAMVSRSGSSRAPPAPPSTGSGSTR